MHFALRWCYMCRKQHEPRLWATVVLVSPIVRMPIDVHLCSQDCADSLVFDYPAERVAVDETRALRAMKEIADGE